jgi:hypothetical protein
VKISEENLKKKTPIKTLTLVEINHLGIENIPLSGVYSGYFRFFNQPEGKFAADQIIKNLSPGQQTRIEKSWYIPFEKNPKIGDSFDVYDFSKEFFRLSSQIFRLISKSTRNQRNSCYFPTKIVKLAIDSIFMTTERSISLSGVRYSVLFRRNFEICTISNVFQRKKKNRR